MKRISLFMVLSWLMWSLHAQERQRLLLSSKDLSGKVLSVPAELAEGPFIAFSLVWPARAEGEWLLALQMEDGSTQFLRVGPDAHNTDWERRVSQLAYLPKETKSFRLSFSPSVNGVLPSWAEVHLYNPGFSEPAPSAASRMPATRMACPCPLPTYQSRTDWCPDGNCPADPTPASTVVTHLIVHHSAGPSSSNDWQAVVRAIWDFHVNVNGWDDIGYNWLIDPDGILYQGRADNVLGAHFCGTNGGTMGVCVLGDFQNNDPAQEALLELEQLLAWKSCDASIDPLATAYHPSSGLNLHRISGHRDGCSTECPGDHLYPLLPQLRQAVRNRMDNLCAAPPSAPAAPTQLMASLVNPNLVQLSWTDNADNETGFILERSEDNNSSYAQLAVMPENTVAFDDLSVLPGTAYYYRVQATAPGASSAYSNEVWVFTGPTAIQDHNPENAITLFPNPAKEEFTLRVDVPGFIHGTVQILDLNGRVVANKPITGGNNKFSTRTMANGLYLLKISTDQISSFRKLIISKSQ